MFFLTLAGLAQAATITVGPGVSYDFDIIQAGIDSAVDGDTVLVAPGEYVITEPVTFRGKPITVVSEAGQDETTVRMGTPADTNRASVVVFENNETDASVLDGFTITGGRGFWFPSVNAFGAGGILFNASSGTVRNCTIVQNSAGYGGGVCCVYPCSPILIDCTIVENSSENSGGGAVGGFGASLTLTDCTITGNSATDGGGVYCVDNSSITITDCTIRGNSATGTVFPTGLGGGLCCTENSLLTLINCTITANSAGISSGGVFCGPTSSVTMTNCAITSNTSQRWGGAMECAHGSAILTNCLIARNTGARGCGGVACAWTDGSMIISNCTIWGNKAGQSGGGVACWQGSSAMVTNSIIWENTSPVGREIEVRDFGSILDIAYSNVAGGQNEVSVEGGSFLNWDEGNIDADPCFADPNNEDYHLKSEAGRWDPNSQTWVMDDVTSPCIDAGDPNSDWSAELWPHGERINMGAYGGTSQASRSLSDAGNVADLNRDGIVDSADMRIMVDHWGQDEPLCDIGPMPWGDGIVDIQDLIVLAENLFEERN